MTPPGGSGAPGLRLAFLGDPNSRHLQRWWGACLDRGHEVHALVPEHDVITAALDPRITVHRFVAWPRLPIRGLGSARTALALRGAIRAIRPAVLHAHYLTRYGWAAWLSGFHPYVVTVWGSDVLTTAPATGQRRRLEHDRAALRAADLVTGGSAVLVERAVALGARPERTCYLHLGVDTARFTPGPAPESLRQQLGLTGHRVVLSNRTIAPLYRQDVVLEALTMLPADVVVIMTRHLAKASDIVAIERLAHDLGVANRLRIVDEMDDSDLPDLYRLADVVVSVPLSDGGPTTLVEALAVGRPIVATDLPAAREWLGDLAPEDLVPVGDAAATARALAVVLARPQATLEAVSGRARRAVQERADRATTLETAERLYQKLAAGVTPARR